MSNNQSFSIQKSFHSVVLNVIPDKEHGFLLPTSEVAKGYGVTVNAVHNQKRKHHDEIIENKHYVSVHTFCLSGKNSNPLSVKTLYWTQRGIVMLGFFIKSERAKQFRTWAENLIIDNLNGKRVNPALPSKAVELFSDDWEETSNTGVYIYKSGVSNALLLPTSRFRNPDEFATEEAIEGFIREDIAKLQYALKTQAWLNAFDGYGIKVYPNGQKVYSTVVAGEYISKKSKMIK